MGFIFEIIVEAIAELLFSLFAEIIGHLMLAFGFRNRADGQNANRMLPWKRGVILGVGLGIFSLLFVNQPILKVPALQILNLVASPLYVGVWTLSLGLIDERAGRHPSEQDCFIYGALFGFTFALTRLVYFSFGAAELGNV